MTALPINDRQKHWAQLIINEVKVYPGIGDLDHRHRAADISLEVALTESSLLMYANSGIPASLTYPHDAVGHDHNSLGLFQQRNGMWGTVGELMSAPISTKKFLHALLALGNWTTGANWTIAQRVQISAFADGSNYRKNDALAIKIRKALYK